MGYPQWVCNDHYELHTVGLELTCVPRNVVVENVHLLQPLCAVGHFALNFRCITCFEAAALGHGTQHDLPQPADIDRSGSGFMDASGGAYILLATGSYGPRLAFTGSASTHTCTLNWHTV